MSLLEFYANLRRALIALRTKIEDAKDGTPAYMLSNEEIRDRLQELHTHFLTQAATFGVHFVKRHLPCGDPRHEDYVMDRVGGQQIAYGDPRFEWYHKAYGSGSLVCVCPCGASDQPVRHDVIIDVLRDPTTDPQVCNDLEYIAGRLEDALERAKPGKPRAAVREELLLAELAINDMLLPLPMERYIEQQLLIAGITP